MALVKICNDAKIDYKGTFRENIVEIPAGGFIEMGRAEAHKFLGQYSDVIVDGAGRHKMPKALRMDEDPEVKAERYNQPLKFTAFDNSKFRTLEGMQAHEKLMQTQNKDLDDGKPKRRRTAPTITI